MAGRIGGAHAMTSEYTDLERRECSAVLSPGHLSSSGVFALAGCLLLLAAGSRLVLAAGVPLREREDAWRSFIWRETPTSNDVARRAIDPADTGHPDGVEITSQSFERLPDAGGRLRPVITVMIRNLLPARIRALRVAATIRHPDTGKRLLHSVFDHDFAEPVGVGQSAVLRLRPPP